MNIPTPEYEQRRSIFQLCDWINNKLRDLGECSDFEERYFERRGQNVKNLLEEAVPIARLGLYFWRPWRDVWVTCLAGNEPYDAELTLQGSRKTETMQIEVTVTETDETTMWRQALAREGYAFTPGAVRREGRRIASEPKMVDVNEQRKRLLQCAFDRFQAKAEKEDDTQTAILIYVNSNLSLPFWSRAELMQKTRNYLRTQRPLLYGVYYCYEVDHGVDGLRNDINHLC